MHNREGKNVSNKANKNEVNQVTKKAPDVGGRIMAMNQMLNVDVELQETNRRRTPCIGGHQGLGWVRIEIRKKQWAISDSEWIDTFSPIWLWWPSKRKFDREEKKVGLKILPKKTKLFWNVQYTSYGSITCYIPNIIISRQRGT